jgi:hypothetical protein
MALGLGRSLLLFLGGLVLFAAPACVVESKDRNDGDDDDDETACQADVDCYNGQICGPDDVCIPEPQASGGSSSGGSGSGTGGGTTAGTGPSNGGSGPNNGGTSGSSTAGSSSGGQSAGGTTGDGGTSGGVPPTAGTGGSAVCSEDDPFTCPTTDSMTLCIEGEHVTLTCVEACETILGLATGPCATPDGCACGDVIDEECSTGVSAYCSCVEGNCTDDEAFTYYVSCHTDTQPDADILKCLDDYVDLEAETVDCEAGFAACFPEEA